MHNTISGQRLRIFGAGGHCAKLVPASAFSIPGTPQRVWSKHVVPDARPLAAPLGRSAA
ncbi:hypothetical protein ACFQAT_01340 [Undibacterium arcticum]|uniref:hypothetical protein n=1 Tax=Undibacterium arcticum TaxID=1762892 RepID=UPI0036240BD0